MPFIAPPSPPQRSMRKPPNLQSANVPFDAPNGDAILRSSDNVDFYITRAVLSLSSRFFSKIFSTPQDADKENGRPVIQVEEDSLLLDLMLRFCYPCPSPGITQVELLERLLDVARKYDLPTLIQGLEVAYVSVGEINVKPIKAYLLACRYKWRVVAQSAANASLKYSIQELVAQELGTETAAADHYRDLLSYHTGIRTACRDMCVSGGTLPTARRNMGVSGTLPTAVTQLHDCPCGYLGRDSDARRVPVWFIKYLDRTGVEFMLSGPLLALDKMLSADETFREIHQISRSQKCIACSGGEMIPNIMKFVRELRDKLVSVIEKTPVPIPF